MISPETIARIRDAMRIEEVVGEFVSLRKRGANLIGLCPFHNEKTPSFNVHPVKGIFKCFGCGEGGNPIDFLIKHEQLNYVEALRWLARKYNIEITEEELTEEQSAAHELRERLFNLNSFAASWFGEQIKSGEGLAIAMAYCRERGITDESIEKFGIGYSPDSFDAFATYALKGGYDKETILKSGLCYERNGSLGDRFRGRLIFPIHNISGRVLGFGGRLLRNDAQKAKYINSPETEVYQKSKVLYGIYQGRSPIASNDNSYLVEGYTDVIGLHQAGISNVVASSGTALTEEQIRLMRRYSNNITIIFDGDTAGIKASFRGIDMILKEGMNVRIVPMPEGEDPDSFARSHRSSEVNEYLQSKSEDFITFKAGLLKDEAANDPVKLGTVIREIISSVALIPDPLLRPLFIKKCSAITGMEEEQLVYELNRQLRSQKIKSKEYRPEELPEVTRKADPQQLGKTAKPLTEYQEDDIVRLLLNYANYSVDVITDDGSSRKSMFAYELTTELMADQIVFDNPLWQKIYEPFCLAVEENMEMPGQEYFIHHEDPQIRAAAVDMISFPYQLSSNWKKRRIFVLEEHEKLNQALDEVIHSFRMRKIEAMMQKLQAEIAESSDDDEIVMLMNKYQNMLRARTSLARVLGRTITF